VPEALPTVSSLETARSRRSCVSGRRLSLRYSLVVAAALVICCLAVPGAATGSPPGSALRYIHDADGRLKAVIDPEGQAAMYAWDAAGNLQSVLRQESSTLSIIQLSPAEAAAGETIEIEGTGFSTTPALDIVEFSGAEGTVTAATATSLTVEVPEGAESGPLTVSVPGEGPATSPQNFVLLATGPPHVASISPTIAKAGDEVTISGTDFNPSPLENDVRFNRARVEPTSASSGSLAFTAPVATLGGHISVRTQDGLDVGPDLFVPPGSHISSDVVSTGRIALGGTGTFEISASGKVGLELFDAQKGERVAAQISESSLAGQISIWSPQGSKVPGSEMSFSKSGSGFMEPITLPESGTYTVLIEGVEGQTGSAKLGISTIKDQTGTIVPTEGGTEQAVSLTTPGQNARFSVPVSAGEVVSIKDSGGTFENGADWLEWRLPHAIDGLVSSSYISLNNGFVRQRFATSGTYTLVINPIGTRTGSVNLKVYDAPDLTGSTLAPTEEGTSETFPVEIPGQHNLITFSGSKEQDVSVLASEADFYGTVRLMSPKGTELDSVSFPGTGEARTIEPVSLPEAGTYTLLLEGAEERTGNVKLSVYEVNDQTGSITPTEGGAKQAVTLSAPGQNARFSVPVSAGEVVSVKAPSSSFKGVYLAEWRKAGGELIRYDYIWPSGGLSRQEFPSAGTYTLVINPMGADTGSVNLTVFDASDLTGATLSPSAEGTSETFPVKVPGQHNSITFSGAEEELVSLVASEGNFSGTVTIKSPKGASLGTLNIWSNGEATSIERIALPESGTYTFLLEGPEGQIGSAKLTAYEVKDQTGSITPTEEGTEQAVSLTAPGQTARFSVSVSAGEVVSVKAPSSGFKSPYYFGNWYKAGGELLEMGFVWSSGGLLRHKFVASGTYTLVIDPLGGDTGGMTLTAYEAPDLTGSTLTPSEEGTSETFSIEIPGQHNLISFSGTEGQKVSLSASKSNFFGSVTLKTPAGESIGPFSVWGTGETTSMGPVTLPESGTYTILLQGTEAQIGDVELSAYLGSGIAWRFTPGVATQLISLDTSSLESDLPPRTRPHLAPRIDGAVPVYPSPAETSTKPLQPAREPTRRDRHVAQHRASRVGEQSSAHSALLHQFRPDERARWVPPESTDEHRGWETEAPQTPWQDVQQLRAGPGQTALAGQILQQNGLPLRGIRVSVEGAAVSTRSDKAGRFLLAGTPAGHQILVVDGDQSESGKNYGSYEMGVDVTDGRTTELEYTIWLTPLDPTETHKIDWPIKRERRIKSARIPGLEVRLPAGTVIRNANGKRIDSLNITAIPVDRPPSPLPGFQTIPLYFTIQPGRAYLSKGAQIVYPNWTHLAPGQRVAFWNYDAHDRGWYIYGHGSVTSDGSQIVPDPGVRVWEFTGAMISGTPLPPGRFPVPGGGSSGKGGDPVDLHSGLFTYHKTDLTLPDTIPIVIERTYRQGDANSYSFGRGDKGNYDLELWSVNNYHEVDLILPDGGRVHYDRISPGSYWTEAIYRSTGSPGQFYGSTITWDDTRGFWNLRLTNGLIYMFGDNAPLQGIRDAHGNELTVVRESGTTGRITKIVSPHGRWVRFHYEGSTTQLTDSGGRNVTYEFEGPNLLSSVTDAEGRTTEYEYDGSGNMTSIVDGRGIKYLETEYDGQDRVSEQTDGDGGKFEFEYETNGKEEVEATTVTEPRGDIRKVAFNAEGFTTSETVGLESEDEATTSFERQGKTGLLLGVVDPLGRKTSFEYDSDGNPTKVIELPGEEEERVAEFTYNPGTDQLTTATDPLGHTTEYEFGPDGELLAQVDPMEDETSFEYTADGQLAAVTGPEGETTELSYSRGDLSGVKDPLGRETKQFVDALGRTTSSTAPSGDRTRFGYNKDDELTSVVSPSGATTTIEYDEDGDPVVLTDPRGNETIATYDQMDRLETETDPLKHVSEWVYDGAGNLIEAIDRRGEVSKFEYDPLGRLEAASYGVSGESTESTVAYEYDAANRVEAVNDSVSGEFGFAYDELDQLKELAGPSGAIGYLYDEGGRREAMEVPGQEPVEYAFDKANRLTGLARGGEATSIEYDKASRPKTITLPDGIEQAYEYDEAGEPTAIAFEKGVSSLGDLNYAYDRNGRTEAIWGSLARTGMPEALTSTEYNADNELVKREGEELEYDKSGNLISDGSSEYEWDAKGQLTNISKGTSAAFSYDPFGRRSSKTLEGTTTEMLYDGANVVQESVEGSPTANLLTGLQPDQTYSRTTPGGTASYLTDVLGSTMGLANGAGEIKTSYTYDPFGVATSAGAASTNPFQYTGRENDGTGLQYNRARYYSASAARFISQDPTGMAGSGPNLYLYVADDPMDLIDPAGLELQSGGPNLPPDVPCSFFPSPPNPPSIGPDLGNNLPLPGTPEPPGEPNWDAIGKVGRGALNGALMGAGIGAGVGAFGGPPGALAGALAGGLEGAIYGAGFAAAAGLAEDLGHPAVGEGVELGGDVSDLGSVIGGLKRILPQAINQLGRAPVPY
jgi:RHS repeat-associated protein